MSLGYSNGGLLAGLGWRARIYAFAGLLTFGTIAVGVVGGIAILYVNASIQDAVGQARQRAEVAVNARLAIIGIDRAQARLVSAQTPEAVRHEAVAAIRAASSLDESLQTLEQTLASNPLVTELIKLNQQVTSTRMVIIKAAKAQDIATAQEQSDAISSQIARIEELSDHIFTDQQSTLTERVEDSVRIGRRTIALLVAFVIASVAVAIAVSLLFARQLNYSIREIQRTIGCAGGGVDSGNNLALAAHAGHVAGVAEDISSCEERLADAVNQIKAGALNVRNATDESGRELDNAAEHIENMANSVAANADNIARIVRQFEVMKSDMQSAIDMTQGLQRAVGNISAIANAISAISSQTNLLALNAAIEAARAGTHGRGFAVVAGEVRSLAGRTGQATHEIHAIAHGIDNEVSKAVASLNKSANDAKQYADQLSQIHDSSTMTAESTATARQMMDAVSSRMAMQREAVDLIEEQLTEVDSTTLMGLEHAASLREVSEALNESAVKLAQIAERIKL